MSRQFPSEVIAETIDADYPIAGQDNDSQGFRDNFSVIKDGLATAKAELTDLQTNTARLDDNNNFGGYLVDNATTNRLYGTVYTTTDAGSISVDLVNGPYQEITVTGTATLIIDGWPTEDVYASMKLALKSSTATAYQVTLSAAGGSNKVFNSLPADGIITIDDDLQLIDVWTIDQGATVYFKLDASPTVSIINDLTDVVITSPANGQVLKYNGTAWVNGIDAIGDILTIDNLTDVVITGTPADGQVLKYDTATSKWINAADAIGDSLSLDNLTDVVITGTPADGQVLKYDIGTSKWVNGTDNVDDNLVTYVTKIVDDGSGIQDVFELDGTKLKTSTGVKMDFGFEVGNTYRFDLSDSSNAQGPLRFSTTADTAMPASITPYTTGVTIVGTEGTPGAYVQILISNSTPSLFLYSDETGIDTSLIGAALEIPQVRNQQYSGSEDLVSATAASVVKSASYFSTAAAETATLAAGTEGQIKVFAMYADTGDMVITVTNAGWKSTGTGTITFANIGEACTLQYINSKWFCIGNNGAVFA